MSENKNKKGIFEKAEYNTPFQEVIHVQPLDFNSRKLEFKKDQNLEPKAGLCIND